MAYTQLTVYGPTIGGTEPTYASATLTDGDMFKNSGNEFIHVKNGGGGAVAVTIPTPKTIKGLAIEDKRWPSEGTIASQHVAHGCAQNDVPHAKPSIDLIEPCDDLAAVRPDHDLGIEKAVGSPVSGQAVQRLVHG